ncbi:MAG TPA: lactate dehydrogenase [Clostridium sp.]|jgi:malate/lactate dehydrogenase|uniref:Lactate dehydrogenase n=1 Tax=Clostridium lapidicellarium TaxID=3240931 RepID=A0ABV4E197_9CLOT|nr:lactate dehydrogenase [uncultured Clostridium sp.]NLU08809.1 lactate dehydrogenase [Clostridiales bacterium]HBC96100.1 lactate dehydrogenase [Clostridium sp.]
MQFHYYIYKNKLLISEISFPFRTVEEKAASNYSGYIYRLINENTDNSRMCYYITHPSQVFSTQESLEFIWCKTSADYTLPKWLLKSIEENRLVCLNTAYPNWAERLDHVFPVFHDSSNFRKWNLTVAGLGDVGGTLIAGLRILGGKYINTISIYDSDENRIKRWEYECSQITDSNIDSLFPKILPLKKEEDLFKGDMFIFCVSKGVPEIGENVSDVRLIQFKGNSKVIKDYAHKAKSYNFKGIFAVVSDPVDLLCKSALSTGLLPDQIRGYGLGVMNARANYYALKLNSRENFLEEGRSFGPHGDGLVVANSIKNYNEEVSNYLTEKAKNANMYMRSIGFKPYIAPAISSGAFSIIDTIKGSWNYSSTFLGGAFMGCRNRLLPYGTQLEYYGNMQESLFYRLNQTYKQLLKFKP